MKNKMSFILIVAMFAQLFSAAVGAGNIHAESVADSPQLHWEKVQPASQPPSKRAFASMVYDEANGQLLLFGGEDTINRGFKNDLWLWDSVHDQWTNITPSNMPAEGRSDWPSARSYASIVYDPDLGKVILFGGANEGTGGQQGVLNDTWIWDGSSRSWTKLSSATAPTARDSGAMVYDKMNKRILLFGGMNSNLQMMNDTWVLEHNEWKQLSPAESPSPRQGSFIIYDEQSKRIVLYGGDDHQAYDDTWVWDDSAASWHQLTLSDSPSSRKYGSTAYDGTAGVLFGGTSGSINVGNNDTWMWIDNHWVEVTDPSAIPTSLSGAAMAYHTGLKQLIMFGGMNSSGSGNETWRVQYPYVRNVSIDFDTKAAAEAADWQFHFVTGTEGELAGGRDTITLRGPLTFPNQRASYTVNGLVVPESSVTVANHAATITVPDHIGASSAVTVLVRGVINPAGGRYAPELFTVETSQEWKRESPSQDIVIEEPSSISVDAPSSLLIGSSATVTGYVYGPTGQLVSGETVRLEPSAGQMMIDTVRTDVNGRFQSVFSAPEQPGTVTIAVYAEDSKGARISTSVHVQVYDTDAPVIALAVPNPMDVEAMSSFNPPPATATDKQDGDLSSFITVTGVVYTDRLGLQQLNYSVQDSSQNKTTVTLEVNVRDTTPPELVLTGSPLMEIKQNEPFVDPGARAIDLFDGDLTDGIQVTGQVDSSIPGNYALTYQVEDSSGNKSQVLREVVVKKKPSVQPIQPHEPSQASSSPIPSQLLRWKDVLVEKSDGSHIRMSIDLKKLQQYVIQENSLPLGLPLIPELKGSDFTAELSVPVIKLLQEVQPDATLLIQTKQAGYDLPLRSLELPKIAEQLDVPIDHVTVEVQINDKEEASLSFLGKQLQDRSIFLHSDFVNFGLQVKAGDKTSDIPATGIKGMKTYIKLADQAIDFDQWTVITTDPDSGTARFAPAVFEQSDQGWNAFIIRPSYKTYAVASRSARFVDINQHWAENDISLLASKLIIEGMDEAHFGPNEHLTRGQWAALMVRMLGLDMTDSAGVFYDVSSDYKYMREINAAYEAGLITGYEDHTFRPEQDISREELAQLVYSILKFAGIAKASANEDTILSRFSDDKEIADWARAGSAAAVSSGMIQGIGADCFAPHAQTTRAETAVLVRRLLEALHYINS